MTINKGLKVGKFKAYPSRAVIGDLWAVIGDLFLGHLTNFEEHRNANAKCIRGACGWHCATSQRDQKRA